MRSTDPDDYQSVPRPLGAMAKSFPDGFRIQPHSHRRDQFVYAVNGTMRVHTGAEAWIVPPDRAVYLPAGVEHAIDIRGDVEMRTVYLTQSAAPDLPTQPIVVEVRPLLRALILALIEEPVLYDEAGRGGAIARLILSEIARARSLPLRVPMPSDPRLRRVCSALLADPADASSLSDSGFSINNDGCSAAPARSSDRRRRPDHVLTGFISARRWRHGRPISRISTENRLFASLGRAQDKDPLHVPRHGHKTPFAAHLIQPTQ